MESTQESTNPATLLFIAPWVDSVIDRTGHAPESEYIERYYLPIIGPSATWTYRKLARAAAVADDGAAIDRQLLAESLGLGVKPVVLHRTLARLVQFRLARWTPERVLEVRCRVPNIPGHWLARLAPPIRREHERDYPGHVRLVSA